MDKVESVTELIGKEFQVLDHGFVRLVDYMGSDAAIVQAARVSYGKGTRKRHEDRGLIRYLMRHRHTTPFEMVEFKFHVKLPIFVARQWIRHRTANVNEQSGRYSVMEDEFYLPQPDDLRQQSETNRQGRGDQPMPPELQAEFIKILNKSNARSYEQYRRFIDAGLVRELARINLPLSLYTQWYWKIDLHNLFHFLKLRLDSKAQEEFRRYAQVMADIVSKIVPMAWEAFADYQLNAVNFSRPEMKLLADSLEDINLSHERLKAAGLDKLEIIEFNSKLTAIKSASDSTD
ncbi:MAG: FAD-dependent thymidylate synthase [candidate division Zixibacteria bacterium]|nr:FAD-dependent thymidylate synthase [candidate division Zixibacteria bacterium]